MIVHASKQSRFIKVVNLLSKSGFTKGDVREQLWGFRKWLSQLLLIILEGPTIIILDNASYHRLAENYPLFLRRK